MNLMIFNLVLLLLCATISSSVPRKQPTATISFWRPSTKEWFIANCEHRAPHGTGIGQHGDIPVNADYNGIGTHEFAVYSPTGVWSIKDRETGQWTIRQHGEAADIPLTGDYTGDGKADFTVWSPATGLWSIMDSVTLEVTTETLGRYGDIPVSGDFTGDGVNDFVVFQPLDRKWSVKDRFGNKTVTQGQGQLGDIPMSGDFDGDGINDFVVYQRSGNWHIINSSNKQARNAKFGEPYLIPMNGDFTGDGISDLVTWNPRNGVWSVNGGATIACGKTYDIPVTFV